MKILLDKKRCYQNYTLATNKMKSIPNLGCTVNNSTLCSILNLVSAGFVHGSPRIDFCVPFCKEPTGPPSAKWELNHLM